MKRPRLDTWGGGGRSRNETKGSKSRLWLRVTASVLARGRSGLWSGSEPRFGLTFVGQTREGVRVMGKGQAYVHGLKHPMMDSDGRPGDGVLGSESG